MSRVYYLWVAGKSQAGKEDLYAFQRFGFQIAAEL
jgi:hypothetical protein